MFAKHVIESNHDTHFNIEKELTTLNYLNKIFINYALE